jgi:transcriptional regulator with XRE-family HTH domain
MEALARLFRDRRQRLGYSQLGLAEEASVPHGLVLSIEYGSRRSPPEPAHVDGLARALEVTTVEILRASGYKL